MNIGTSLFFIALLALVLKLWSAVCHCGQESTLKKSEAAMFFYSKRSDVATC